MSVDKTNLRHVDAWQSLLPIGQSGVSSQGQSEALFYDLANGHEKSVFTGGDTSNVSKDLAALEGGGRVSRHAEILLPSLSRLFGKKSAT